MHRDRAVDEVARDDDEVDASCVRLVNDASPTSPGTIGYYKGEDIEACERGAITIYIARPQRGTRVHAGHFPEDRFRYDAGMDVYRCPAGQ